MPKVDWNAVFWMLAWPLISFFGASFFQVVFHLVSSPEQIDTWPEIRAIAGAALFQAGWATYLHYKMKPPISLPEVWKQLFKGQPPPAV